MRTTKSKKTVVAIPVSEPVTNEHSNSYLKIKAFLEKNNTELDPKTRHFFDDFYLGESTRVMDMGDQIIAIKSHGAGSYKELFVTAKGTCSMSICLCGGF